MSAPVGAVHGARFAPIPHVIHQTWKTADVPERWRGFQASWRAAHPSWRYVLWTDEDNRRLIADRYPWFLPVYDGFPRHIQRVDAAKYFILYTDGGVYADLDCECLQPLDDLIGPGGMHLARTRDRVIEGALMASPPAHPFWRVVFAELQQPPRSARFVRLVPGFEASHVLLSTGPRMLNRAVRRYVQAVDSRADAAALTVHHAGTFSDRSWLARHEPFRGRRGVARHHYSDSWLLDRERRIVAWLTIRRLRWVAAAIAAGIAALVWLR